MGVQKGIVTQLERDGGVDEFFGKFRVGRVQDEIQLLAATRRDTAKSPTHRVETLDGHHIGNAWFGLGANKVERLSVQLEGPEFPGGSVRLIGIRDPDDGGKWGLWWFAPEAVPSKRGAGNGAD